MNYLFSFLLLCLALSNDAFSQEHDCKCEQESSRSKYYLAYGGGNYVPICKSEIVSKLMKFEGVSLSKIPNHIEANYFRLRGYYSIDLSSGKISFDSLDVKPSKRRTKDYLNQKKIKKITSVFKKLNPCISEKNRNILYDALPNQVFRFSISHKLFYK